MKTLTRFQIIIRLCKLVSFILLIMLSLSVTVKTYAQEPQPVIGMAMYNLTQVTDTNNKGSLFRERWILYIGANAAMFQSYDKLVRDSIILGKMKSPSTPLSTAGFGKVNHTIFYFFENGSKHFRKEQIFSNYVFPLERPNYNWKVQAEKKVISGLTCQKATGYWKGRSYTAWFTPDLLFKYGPWNMNGLPGLIIEAYDVKREVVFEFAGFEKNNDSSKKIAFPTNNLVKLTEREYLQIQKVAREDPLAFTQTMLGGSVKIEGYNPNRKSTFNNPIELDKK